MKKRISALIELIRHGNSLNAQRATHIKIELMEIHESLDNMREIAIFESLNSIITNQQIIMDQNATISAAIQKLGIDISAEIASIKTQVQPGMTDEQAQAIVDQLNGLDSQVIAATQPAADTTASA